MLKSDFSGSSVTVSRVYYLCFSKRLERKATGLEGVSLLLQEASSYYLWFCFCIKYSSIFVRDYEIKIRNAEKYWKIDK